MSISYIGSTLSVAVGRPATEDPAGYGAMAFDEVGKIVSIGSLKDTAEDVAFARLKDGRQTHVNGVKNVGDVPCMCEFDKTDPGQITLVSNNNNNTSLSFKVEDADGEIEWFYGLAVGVGAPERTANTYKAREFVMRVQSGLTPSV